jgi:phosphoribosylaminoimidazole-succinocarboxamide synthase
VTPVSEPLPPGYVDKIHHPTSVKTIFIVRRPTETEPGIADFRFNPVFSVFDYGTLQPPVPLDNSTIALMAGYNFERLREAGIESHYLGMVREREMLSAAAAIRQGLAPDTLRVRLVNRLLPVFGVRCSVFGVRSSDLPARTPNTEHRTPTPPSWDYSVFHQPPANHFVVPIEFISRVRIGANSSVWKRVARGDVTLADLGLPADLKPGDPLPQHVLDYSTKYEPEDRYLTAEQARAITGFSPDRWAKINRTTAETSRLMTELARARGVEREDGKIEYVALDHAAERDVLGDAVTTLHEDRLLLDGMDITKQAIRNAVRLASPAWAAEIDRAKTEARQQGVADFRTLMDPAICYVSPPAEFFERYNALARAFVNHWVEALVYPQDRDLSRRLREFRVVAEG